MRLEEALKISKVERVLDGEDRLRMPAAKAPFYSKYRLDIESKYEQLEKANKYIISRGMDDFIIVWASTMKPISRNPLALITDFSKIIAKDDWEPL